MKKILLALAMFFTVAVSAQDETWTGLWQQNSYEFFNSSKGSSTCFFAILDNSKEGLKVVNFSIYEEDTVEVTVLKRDQYGFEMELYNPDNKFKVIWVCKVLNKNTIKVQFQEIDSGDWSGELTLERKKII
jgi:hypothetical protein